MALFKRTTSDIQSPEPVQAADSARVVGSKGLWTVYLCKAGKEWPLVLGQNMRVFRHFESVVVQLKNRGISQFQVDIEQEQAADKEVVISPLRPKVLQRAATAEAYDTWFRNQVKRCLVAAQAPLSAQTVQQAMTEFKAHLHKQTEVSA